MRVLKTLPVPLFLAPISASPPSTSPLPEFPAGGSWGNLIDLVSIFMSASTSGKEVQAWADWLRRDFALSQNLLQWHASASSSRWHDSSAVSSQSHARKSSKTLLASPCYLCRHISNYRFMPYVWCINGIVAVSQEGSQKYSWKYWYLQQYEKHF